MIEFEGGVGQDLSCIHFIQECLFNSENVHLPVTFNSMGMNDEPKKTYHNLIIHYHHLY